MNTSETNAQIENAVNSYISQIPTEQIARVANYWAGNYWIQLWNFLLILFISYFVLRSGLSDKLRKKLTEFTRRRFIRDFLFSSIYFVLIGVLTFPFILYTDFFRSHQYFPSGQGFGSWFTNFLISGSFITIGAGLFGAVIFFVIRGFQRTWWLWASAVTFAFIFVTAVIFPILILPALEDLKPLTEGAAHEAILTMSRTRDIAVNTIYVIETPKESKGVNAAAGGFFGKMDIYLNDNLIERSSIPEIRAVIAHEIGHYVLGHPLRNLLLNSLLFTIGFLLTQLVFGSIVPTFGKRYGVQNVGDIAGLPLLIAIFFSFLFLITPLRNSIQRTAEHEADLFGLELSQEPDGLAQVVLKFSEFRKASPTKLEEIIFFDHPSPRSRIEQAMRWKFEHEISP